MIRRSTKQILCHIAIIGALALAAMSSSFYYGLTSSNDLNHHLQLARAIYDSVTGEAGGGEFYPSLAPRANGEYGSVAVRFYPPFSYYLLSAANFLLGDWYDACRLVFFLLFWASGVGVYLWSREEFPEAGEGVPILAAALYIFAPYHLNEIYNNFFYPEFTAAAILPFCFLFVARACRGGKLRDIAGLAAAYALLTLTHLPLTVIGSLGLGIYGLALLKKGTILKTLCRLAAGVALGLAASGFYWIRMVTELGFVNLSDKSFYSGIYDYRVNFLFNPQNILNFQNDSTCLWLAEIMLFAILLISLPSFFLLARGRKGAAGKSATALIAVTAVFLVSVFMTSPLSQFIWERLAFLQNVQFPWRWLAVISLSGAVFSSLGIVQAAKVLNRGGKIWQTAGFALVLAFFVFSSTFIIKNAVYLERGEFDSRMDGLDDEHFDRFWWTVWAKTEALQIREKVLAEKRSVEIRKWNATEKEFVVSPAADHSGASDGDDSQVRVAMFYYPHWRAEIDGAPAEIRQTGDGAVSVSVPAAGGSVVKLFFREPQIVKAAAVISIFTWLMLLIGVFGERIRTVCGKTIADCGIRNAD